MGRDFFCTTHLKAGIRRAIDASVHLQMRSVVDEMRTRLVLEIYVESYLD